MDRWELEKKIVMKALKDPVFKQKLQSNPKEALKEFCKGEKGIDLALLDKITVKVLQEKQGEWTLALPNFSQENRNLSEQELNRLFAGGYTGALLGQIII